MAKTLPAINEELDFGITPIEEVDNSEEQLSDLEIIIKLLPRVL